VDPSRLHYARSLALHKAVAERLRQDPALLERTREQLETWIARGGRSAALLMQWRAVLSRSPEEIAAFLTDPSERAAWLRSASPFAGVLDPRTRLAILRSVARDGDGPDES
jgi:hypothetical protein